MANLVCSLDALRFECAFRHVVWPTCLLEHMLTFLSPRDLALLSGVCQSARFCTSRASLWHVHFSTSRQTIIALLKPSLLIKETQKQRENKKNKISIKSLLVRGSCRPWRKMFHFLHLVD